MDDKVYEIESEMTSGCTVIMFIVAGFMVFVVLAMVCNWLNSF